mgnify:CR=1 FL=1
MSLNKKEIIYQAFEDYKLDDVQTRSVNCIIDGYVDLIAHSKPQGPSKSEIKIFVDLIKSNLVNTLNVIKHSTT